MNEKCLRCLCCLKKIIFRKDLIVGKCYADFYDHIPFIFLGKTENNKLRIFCNGKLLEGSYVPDEHFPDYRFLEWE